MAEGGAYLMGRFLCGNNKVVWQWVGFSINRNMAPFHRFQEGALSREWLTSSASPFD
jgi:hypothetical protein